MRGPYLLQTCGKWEQNGCHSKYIHRKTGLGAHIQQTDIGYPKSHCIRTSLCSTWVLDLWTPNTDTRSPHSLGFVYFCIRLHIVSFLITTSLPSLNVIVQEWGKNQTLHMNRAGQGMLVSAVCFLHSDYSHQSSTGYLKPNYSNKDPVFLLDGCLHPLLGPFKLFTIDYND